MAYSDNDRYILKNQLLAKDMQARTRYMSNNLVPISSKYSSGGQIYTRLNCNGCGKRIDKEQQYYGGYCIKCAYEKSQQETIKQRISGAITDQSGCLLEKSNIKFVALPMKATAIDPCLCDFVMIGKIRTCGTHGVICQNL